MNSQESMTVRLVPGLLLCAMASCVLLMAGGCQSSFEHLEKRLQSKDPKKREGAAYMLKRHGKRGVPLLRMALTRDSDQRVRRAAALTLGRLGYSEGIPALRKGLSDKHWNVRRECVRSLGMMGTRSAVAARDLLIAWGDDRLEVREDVPRAWKALGLPADKKLTVLTEGLSLQRWRSRVVSAREMGKLRVTSRAAQARLVANLSHKRHEVRGAAASALGRLDIYPHAALVKVLSDKHPKVRSMAAKALGGTKMASQAALQGLVELLGDTSSEVSSAAGTALAALGTQAVPMLVERVRQPSWKHRQKVFRILGWMGPRARSAVPALVSILQSPQKDYGKNLACETLAKIGPDAASAVPALMKILLGYQRGGDSNLARASVQALGRIGRAAIAPLVAALHHKSTWIRSNAAVALGLNGRVAKPAVRALVVAVNMDKERWVRESSARALGQIGVASKVVQAALMRALRDSSHQVKKAAQKALANLAGTTSPTKPHLGTSK